MITVLMPVYNEERYLKEAITSVLNQTFTSFEFLIVDDGSTDKTKDILASQTDPRIKVLTNTTKLGVAASLNIGLKVSNFDIIARMDADDISDPTRLEMQYKALTSSDALMALCWNYIIKKGTIIKPWTRIRTHIDIIKALHRKALTVHGTWMFKRDIVLAEGGYNEKYRTAEDYELQTRLAAKGYKFLMVPKYLYTWRVISPVKDWRVQENNNDRLEIEDVWNTYKSNLLDILIESCVIKKLKHKDAQPLTSVKKELTTV